MRKPNKATSHLVALWDEMLLVLSIIGGAHGLILTDPKGPLIFGLVLPLRYHAPHLHVVGSELTYGSVPEDGDFPWFGLRHISFWLSHLVLGLYRNLQPDGIQIQGLQRFDIQTSDGSRNPSSVFVLMKNFTLYWNFNVIFVFFVSTDVQ